MDEAIFQQMVLALRAVAEVKTRPEERYSAQAFLETFKEREDALDYAFYVLSSPQDDFLRYFGLHVIERVIRMRWKTMTESQRLSLRRQVCQLMVDARPLLAEAAYMKEKTASLVADLVERDFPQRWTTFVEELLSVAEMGAAQAEFALKTLATVSEDCTNAEFNSKVSTARRNDVLRGLNALMDHPILPWLYSLMSAARQQGRPEDVLVLKAGLQLLQHLIPWVPRSKFAVPQHNFLQVFTALLPDPSMNAQALACLQTLSSFDLEPAILGQMLSELPQSCWGLIQGLEGGVERLLGDDLFFAHNLAQTVAGFGVQNVAQLSAYLEKPGDPRAQLLKVYLDMSTFLMELPSKKMASALLPLFAAFARDSRLREFAGFVEVVPKLLASLCECCVRSWVGEDALDAIAEAEFNDGDEASAFVHVLRSQANALAELIGKLHLAQTATFVARQFDALVNCHGSVNGVKSTAAVSSGFGNRVKDDEGHAVMSNPDILFWDACVGRIEHIFGGMTTEQLRMPEVMQCASHALELLFNWTPTDPQFCRARLDAFGSLRKSLRTKPESLMRALDQIFKHITFGSPGSPGSEFAFGVTADGNGGQAHVNGSELIDVTARGREKVARCAVEVRKKADLVLISVCEECADVCVQQLPQICERVNQLLGSGSLVDAQSTHLLEVCCLIARSITDPAVRSTFIEALLETSLGVLTSNDFEKSFESPQGLWTAMGVETPADLHSDKQFIADRSMWYNRFFTALNDVLSVCRRVAIEPPSEMVFDTCLSQVTSPTAGAGGYPPSLEDLTRIQPFTPLWGKVLPQVSKLLRAVQGSWRRENREKLLSHELASQILAMPAPEAILKSSATNNIYAPRPSSRRGLEGIETDISPRFESGRAFYASSLWGPPDKISALWPVWMTEMRNAAYQIIGQAFEGQAIFFIQGLFHQVMAVVLSDVEEQENRHCTTLLRHVIEPLLLSCPPPLYETYLNPILELVVPHFLRRVATAWAAPGNRAFEAQLYSCGALACAADLSHDEKEILADKIKREVTRSWLDVFVVAFGLRGPLLVVVGRSHKTKKGQPGSTKTAFVDSPAEAARNPKRQHANLLKQVFLLGLPAVAESLVLFTIGALTFPDSQTLRRSVQLLSAIIDAANDDPRYYVLIGRDAFAAAVNLLVTSPKHISGIEWEILALLRDVYLHLVIGRSPADLGHGEAPSERWKLKSDLPRQVMLRLPGVTTKAVEDMERILAQNFTSKGQKEAIRSVLREVAAANPDGVEELGGPLLRGRVSSGTIEDLPEKLILRSRQISGGAVVDGPGNLFEGLEEL